MSKKDLTLRRLKNTEFPSIYKKFILANEEKQKVKDGKILSLAVILINSDNEYIQRLGYRIIVLYGNNTKNYAPLFEISINMGLIPISKFIIELPSNRNFENSIVFQLNNSFIETFKKDSIYQSYKQKEMFQYFFKNLQSNLSIVAPTSYGKTDLLTTLIEDQKDKNICILTPTKSLLSQTKQRISSKKIEEISKIITHPDMFTGNEKSLTAVLTQERLLRLIKKNELISFDYVVIDEAHTLFNKSKRSNLLASVIIMLKKRNPNLIVKFLTPFVNDAKNLKIKHAKIELDDYYVQENMKTERFYIYDSKSDKSSLRLYDQYMNEFYTIQIDQLIDDIDFVRKYQSEKNVVFFNKPKDIEDFAARLSGVLDTKISEKINKAISDISEYVHPEYKLIKYLKKGILYHHGSVPDSIRLYVEWLYSEIEDVNFILTSSTLLEGVNLPADKMFLLDNKKGSSLLTPSDFKNLIGRVCRFSNIFNKDCKDLNRLSPQIYLVNSRYFSSNANLTKFLSDRIKVDKEILDNPENVLLEETIITENNKDELEKSIEFIENFEKGAITEDKEIKYANTKIGKACFLNNIFEIPILKSENVMQKEVNELKKYKITIKSADTLLKVINEVFIKYIDEGNDRSYSRNLGRLKNEEARRFYAKIILWRIEGVPYSKMINYFISYWQYLIREEKETMVYAGRWGDETRDGYRPLWTDIKQKNMNDMINLAIVRINEEQDFLDNILIKLVEALYDVELIDDTFYLKVKYGTDDKRKITLVKNGLTLSLSNLLLEKYFNYVRVDIVNNTINVNSTIIDKMKKDNINQIFINELLHFAF